MDGGGQALSLLFAFVLAAMLGPRTFGLVAMAIVYVAFAQMVQRQGMAAAVIQRKELTRDHLDTAFWLVIGTSLALTFATMALASWWAKVNGLPELRPILLALSPLVLIEGLATIQAARLSRQMRFRPLAWRRLIAAAIGGCVGVTGAMLGWEAWALVSQQLTTAVVSLIILWSASGWRPGFRWSTRAARDLLGFSSGSFLSSLAVFANNRADVLMVGLFFGPTVVGVYQLGSRLIDTAVTITSRAVRTLALPELSPHQSEPAEFARRLVRLMRLTAIIALPVLGVIVGSSVPLIQLLGRHWEGAAPVLQVLCIVGLVRVIMVLDGPLLQALGRPFIQAGFAWLGGLISVSTFAVVGFLLQGLPTDRQALLIAIARAAIYGLPMVAMHLFIIHSFTAVKPKAHLAVYAGPLLAAVIAAGAGMTAAYLLSARPLLALALSGTAAITVAAGTLLCLPASRTVLLSIRPR